MALGSEAGTGQRHSLRLSGGSQEDQTHFSAPSFPSHPPGFCRARCRPIATALGPQISRSASHARRAFPVLLPPAPRPPEEVTTPPEETQPPRPAPPTAFPPTTRRVPGAGRELRARARPPHALPFPPRDAGGRRDFPRDWLRGGLSRPPLCSPAARRKWEGKPRARGAAILDKGGDGGAVEPAEQSLRERRSEVGTRPGRCPARAERSSARRGTGLPPAEPRCTATRSRSPGKEEPGRGGTEHQAPRFCLGGSAALPCPARPAALRPPGAVCGVAVWAGRTALLCSGLCRTGRCGPRSGGRRQQQQHRAEGRGARGGEAGGPKPGAGPGRCALPAAAYLLCTALSPGAGAHWVYVSIYVSSVIAAVWLLYACVTQCG